MSYTAKLNRSVDEVSTFLKKNPISVEFGRTSEVLVWENWKGKHQFDLVFRDLAGFASFKGKCSLIPTDEGLNSTLKIRFVPRGISILLFIGGPLVSALGIINIGMANYEKPIFWISILAPTFLCLLIFMFWYLIWVRSHRNIPVAIAESFENYINII